MKFSELARPPIQPAEAESAEHSVCRNHKGLIRFSVEEKDGTVFYCPIGRQYWRYARNWTGMTAPLAYPKSGVL